MTVRPWGSESEAIFALQLVLWLLLLSKVTLLFNCDLILVTNVSSAVVYVFLTLLISNSFCYYYSMYVERGTLIALLLLIIQ